MTNLKGLCDHHNLIDHDLKLGKTSLVLLVMFNSLIPGSAFNVDHLSRVLVIPVLWDLDLIIFTEIKY